MYSLQKDGSLRQISREIAAIDSEHFGLGASANANNTVVLARLPGGKATLRYLQGEAIKIVASLPHSVDPRQLQLHKFQTKGEIRTSYLGRFRGESPGTWNTLSFHAQPLADGSWLLEPNQLRAGEYCFSPNFNNDNYCFGVNN